MRKQPAWITVDNGVTKRKCFVIDTDGQPVMRDIVVGMSNEQVAEIQPWDDEKQTGLKEGEKVVENPRPLPSLRSSADRNTAFVAC